MKVILEMDANDSKEDFQKAKSIVNVLEGKPSDEQRNPGIQPGNTDTHNNNSNTSSNHDDSNDISIVIRDKNKKTIDVKEDLKRHGFTYYKYKKGSKKEDPRYTQTCNKSFWDSIKDQTCFEGLNIWTSDGGD